MNRIAMEKSRGYSLLRQRCKTKAREVGLETVAVLREDPSREGLTS